MRTYRTVTKIESVPDTVKCNKCGTETDPNTALLVFHQGSYNSKALVDGVEYTFDLCEDCLRSLMRSFRIPPHTYDRNDGVEVTNPADQYLGVCNVLGCAFDAYHADKHSFEP